VLPYDPERRVAILVRQFRAPVFHAGGEAEMLEAPAGMLDEDEPANGARREVLEEVGLTLAVLEPVAAVWTMPGISTELMHLFLAPYGAGDRIAAGGGVAGEHEAIIVAETAFTELAAMADRGELTDLKTFTLVQTLRLRRPGLFESPD
jgi:nudix-type nucleoside diphosphatase (YffH/AdpP family)